MVLDWWNRLPADLVQGYHPPKNALPFRELTFGIPDPWGQALPTWGRPQLRTFFHSRTEMVPHLRT